MTLSTSELIRQHLDENFENVDYTSKENRKLDLEKFCIEHNLEYNKTRSLFQKTLKKFIKDKGLNPQDYGIGLRNKIPLIGSDMDATITPKPQPAVLVSDTPLQLQSQQQQLISDPQQSSLTDSRPVLVTKGNHDEKAVISALNAFYLILRTGFAPLAELLTDDEKDTLGKLGKPVFDRFFGENEDLVICFLGIGGVMMPKLTKGRRLKKQKQAKEKESKALSEGLAANDRTLVGDNENG